MHLCDMKKITVIASLLILFTACEKADIRPNATTSSEPAIEATRSARAASTTQAGRSASDPGDNSDGGDSGSIKTGRNTTVSSPGTSSPDPTGGEITDPIRKKDQKDNK